MKKRYKEKNKLPLTFKYIEMIKMTDSFKLDSNSLYFLSSEQYKTENHIREKPFKSLVRLL